MITGGAGLHRQQSRAAARRAGADILIVDSLDPEYGGNRFNLDGIEDAVRVNIADVRDADLDGHAGRRTAK